MVFCGFVVCLIFGESSLQLIEVLQLQYALVFQVDVTNSRPETIFNQIGVVSAKLSVVKQTCVPPQKNILYETLMCAVIQDDRVSWARRSHSKLASGYVA